MPGILFIISLISRYLILRVSAALRETLLSLFVTTLVASLGLAGCATAPPISATRPATASHAYLIELPGMGGITGFDKNFVCGLQQGGVADQTDIHDWTGSHKWTAAVRAWDDNRAAAKKVAEKITAKYREDPSTPIVLAAWSAGAAVTIWALEDLPDDVMVQSVLLIEPAVNPNHDLTCALRHVRGHMFAVETWSDIVVLGIGTTIFGTADGGANTPAAGLVGFNKPKRRDAEQYKKLIELPWELEYANYGDIFGHVMPMSESLARDVLAPMLVRDAGVAKSD
jgi:pimeloyl-ACP methyl ester carboxylesterase